MDQWSWKFFEVSPCTGIGPWMAIPSYFTEFYEGELEDTCLISTCFPAAIAFHSMLLSCQLSGPIGDTPRPPYRAILFRDTIAERGIARVLPCLYVVSRKYRWDTFVGGGYRTSTLHAIQEKTHRKKREGVSHPIGHVETTKKNMSRNRGVSLR